jgi:RNA-binding protein
VATVLTNKDRRYLRSLAQTLKPVVVVGKLGLTDARAGAVDRALGEHELIKVKFNDFKDDKHALVQELETRTGCAVCTVIGHVAVLYRPHPDEEKRRIELPEGGR